MGEAIRATGGHWTTLGSGSFADDSMLVTQYFPSDADTSSGSVKLVLETTGNGLCNSVTDTMEVTFLLNTIQVSTFTPDTNICSNNAIVQVTGSVIGATGGIWSTSGDGVFTNPTDITTIYTGGSADTATGNVVLTLSSTGNGVCSAVTSNLDFVISPAPTVNPGAPDTVCANNANHLLNGSISDGSTSGIWSTSGTGSFVSSDTLLNPTYIPSALDTSLGEIVLVLTSSSENGCDCNCLPVSSTTTLNITPIPVVDAGEDQLVCAQFPQATVNGIVYGATTSGSWTTLGTGTFDDPNLLAPNYMLSASDIANGSVELILTSTNNGECIPAVDTMSISIITDLPVVDAGVDTTVCANNSDINLVGSVTVGSTTGSWTTSGTGSFVFTDSTLTNTYLPSADDDSTGSVELYLTATNSCPIVDTVTIDITPAPLVDAGQNVVLCAGDMSFTLDGSVTLGATSGIWSTSGSGTFTPDNLDFNATYALSPQDTLDLGAMFILTSTNNGNCLAEVDTMMMSITTIPVVNATADDSVCASAPAVIAGSIVGGASSGIWTTSGTGVFIPADTSLFGNYIFSAADTAAGSVMLYLTSTNACINFTDSAEVIITPAPKVDAGSDELVCANNPEVQLDGTINIVTTTGQWSTLGSGSFSPNDSVLNGNYIPSTADILNGEVQLILTSTNNEDCLPVSDTMIVFIEPGPSVNAGEDQNICLIAPNVITGASVTGGATTGIWSSSGTGSFSPDFLTVGATYIPSASDLANGSVELFLESTNNGNCLSEIDSSFMIWTETPTVEAGTNQNMCYNGTAMDLTGLISGGTTTGFWSTTNGGGNFTADSSDLSGQYVPNPSDESIGVEIILSSTGGCAVITDTVLLTFNSALTAGFSASPICDNLLMDFTDTSSINFGDISSWDWNFGDSSTDVVQHPSYTYDTTGTYLVQLVIVSDSGCSDTAEQQVTIRSIDADFIFTETCLAEGVDFTDQSTVANDVINSWLWNFGDSNTSNNQNNDYFYATDGSYDVSLIIETAAGCSDTVSYPIVVNPHPVAGFILGDVITRLVEFEVQDSSQNAVAWNWDFGDGTLSTDQNPTHTYEASGEVEIIQVVTNEFGCKDSLIKTSGIEIIYPPVLPTAFTPNGDGENDVLLVRGGPIKEGTLMLRIYNEWGEMILNQEVNQRVGMEHALRLTNLLVYIFIRLKRKQ